MTVSLQTYNIKSAFLGKPNEERIMSRSVLSYQVDFRTPWEGEISRKNRKRNPVVAAFWGMGVGIIPIPDPVSDILINSNPRFSK